MWFAQCPRARYEARWGRVKREGVSMKTLIPVLIALSLAAVPAMAEDLTIDELILNDTDEAGEPAAEEAPPAFEPVPDTAPDEEAAVTAPVAAELPQPEQAMQGLCTPEQSRQLRELGREYALSLVRNDFLGGRDIESLVQDCTFDGTIYQGVLHIRWRGMLLGWNEYNIWGRLRTFPDGSNATFAPRGASDSVQSLQFWGNIGTIGLQLVP